MGDRRHPFARPARGWIPACPPPSPTVTSPPRTACSPTRRGPSSAASPSASTSTCRSARCGAATATSTPTPPRSSATRCGASRSSYAEAAIARDPLRAPGARPPRRPHRDDLLRRWHPHAAARPPTSGPSWPAPRRSSASPTTSRSRPRPTPTASPPGTSRSCATAGFNRISFGMQSAVDHVLRTLDRTHDPMRVPAVVDWARQAGFDDVSLDLIYGTPGESLADWETSVDVALACRARPRLGVLPHRRGGHRAGPPGQARRAADARRGRPGRQVPPRRRASSPPPG